MSSVLTRVGKATLPSAVRAGKMRGMGHKPNFHIEEWMGKREITEKTFEFTPKLSLGLFVAVVLVPTTMCMAIKKEMQKKDKLLGREREYL